MSEITNSVRVTVRVDDVPLSQAAFNIAAFVGANFTFSTKTKTYDTTDLSGIAADLTNGTDDPEYDAASVIASQVTLVSKIVAIKEEVGDSDITDTLNQAVAENNEWFGLSLISRDATKQADAAAFCKANKKVFFGVSADSQIINDPDTIDNALNARIILDADLITGNNFDCTVNTLPIVTVPFNSDHVTTMGDIVTAITALADITATLDTADTTNRTIIVTHSSQAVAITAAAVTSGASQAAVGIKYQSIAAKLNGLSNDQAMMFYHSLAATEYLDAGAMGRLLAKTPGSYTAKHQRVYGTTAIKLPTSKSDNAHAKGANTYEELYNKNVIYNGTVSSTGFLDVTIFRLWIQARVTENVFVLQTSVEKIPFTNGGIASIGTAIEQILKLGQNNGGISPTTFDDDGQQIGGYVIILPRLQDIPLADRQNRILRNVKVKAWLAGAIHEIEIDITLQL